MEDNTTAVNPGELSTGPEPTAPVAISEDQQYVTHRDIEPLRNYWKQFEEGADGKPALKKQLEETVTSTKSALEEAEQAAKRVRSVEVDLVGEEGKEGLVKRIEANATKIEEVVAQVANDRDAIRLFREEVEGKPGEEKTGLRQELADLKKAFGDQQEAQQKAHETLHKQIEGLLPGAAAAGLAAGYHTQKVQYDKPIQVWSWAFAATMVTMALYALFTFHEPTGFKQALIQISSRLPFLLPVVWLAWHATKQQSQDKMLREGYAHKESLAMTYVGYSAEVEKLPDSPAKNELREKLLRNILEMSAENPSTTLGHASHKDGPPIFDQLKTLTGQVEKIASIVKPNP